MLAEGRSRTHGGNGAVDACVSSYGLPPCPPTEELIPHDRLTGPGPIPIVAWGYGLRTAGARDWAYSAFMFLSRYPRSMTRRARILCVMGDPRGLSIVPKMFPPVPPPETRHRDSCIMPMPDPAKIAVTEWTGASIELHMIDS